MTQQTNPQPPDRSHLLTEKRNPRSMNLHSLTIAQCVKLMNEEDRTIAEAVKNANQSITEFITATHQQFNENQGRLIYLGAGTSGRLGVLDAAEAPPTFQLPENKIIGLIAGGDRSLRKSSEGLEDDYHGAVKDLKTLQIKQNDTILGIASGGTTPYVLGALDYAKTHANTLTALLTCTPVNETQFPFIDHLITIETGPEILTGSTRLKAGTATKMVLNIISTTLMVQQGRIYQNLMVDLRATNDKLTDRAARIIMTLTNLNRNQALELLNKANGKVKTAVIMHKKQIDQPTADKLLSKHKNHLQSILNNDSP